MLELDDPRWNELHHAYGPAGDIPDLLRQLAGFPPHDGYESEPYFSLWSALCHQDDVYSASYAAVPHILRCADTAPLNVNWSTLLLVTSIEIGRANGRGPAIPADLLGAYHDALSRVPKVLAQAAAREWDELFTRAASALLAAARGYSELAEAILELEPEHIGAFLEWAAER